MLSLSRIVSRKAQPYRNSLFPPRLFMLIVSPLELLPPLFTNIIAYIILLPKQLFLSFPSQNTVDK